MIKSDSGIYYNKNWEEAYGTYQGSAIPNENAAVQVADVIFNNMRKSSTAEGFRPQSVFFDTEDEIWIVSFWEPNNDLSTGNCCSIAIKKNDGKVLRIWFTE